MKRDFESERRLRNVRRYKLQIEGLLDLMEGEARTCISESKQNNGGDSDGAV